MGRTNQTAGISEVQARVMAHPDRSIQLFLLYLILYSEHFYINYKLCSNFYFVNVYSAFLTLRYKPMTQYSLKHTCRA